MLSNVVIVGGENTLGPYIQRQNGRTAVIWAADAVHTNCLHLLVKAGANLNAKDQVQIFPAVAFCVFIGCDYAS